MILWNVFNCTLSVSADETVWGEISIEDEFSENRVIVVLDNKTSLQFNNYVASDFSNIGCKEIIDISTAAGNRVACAMENISQHVISGVELEKYNGVAFGDYHQILCLELATPGKANVISAISKLSAMDGVYVACPDYRIKAYTYNFDPNEDNSMDYDYNNNVDYLDLIDLYGAWGITTGSNTVKVAILDSGIDSQHEDLSMNFETTSSLSGFYNNGVFSPGPASALAVLLMRRVMNAKCAIRARIATSIIHCFMIIDA